MSSIILLKSGGLTSTGQQFAGVKLSFTGKVTGNKMEGTREIDSSAVSSEGGGAGGGAPGGSSGDISDAWTAVKK